MRFLALASDYDGTLANGHTVSPRVIGALERLTASGRRLILVTGREVEDLVHVFPEVELFDHVVAENGAVLFRPGSGDVSVLAERPPPAFLRELVRRGVQPLSEGRVIVSTRSPHETAVLEVVRDLGLELHVIFNKGAVMILPSGVNKATGLFRALHELGLSRHNVVGVGDAENDHALLRVCEAAVSVANALPALKEECDLVTSAPNGDGVAELADRLLADDLSSLRLGRHSVPLGNRTDGQPVCLPPYGRAVLVAGRSGSGKSTCGLAILERLAERGYQFCLIDPEGDHEGAILDSIAIGSARRPPTVEEVIGVLGQPDRSVVVTLLGIPLGDRPRFFARLLMELLELRRRTGRPHWIAVDEAHHLMPVGWDPVGMERNAARLVHAGARATAVGAMMLLTTRPALLAPAVLRDVDLFVALGEDAPRSLTELAHARRLSPPTFPPSLPGAGEAWVWSPSTDAPALVRLVPGRAQHLRHKRKYAEGDLGDHAFFFRGREGKLRLRAQNLMLFIQIGAGVDDETWFFHLRGHDYSRWFQDAVKDPALAATVKAIEDDDTLSADETRERVARAIEERYTIPG